jgi:hypothetical protein
MSQTEPSGDELDRNTITAGKLASWLNEHGPDWVLEIEPLDGDTEYLGFVDGRFKAYNERGIDLVALDYLDEIADRSRRIAHLPVGESPLAPDEDDADADADE